MGCYKCTSLTFCLLLACMASISTGYSIPPSIKSVTSGLSTGYYFIYSKNEDVTLECLADRPGGLTNIWWRSEKSQAIPSEWRVNRQGDSAIITLPVSAIATGHSKYELSYECVVNNSAGVAVSSPIKIRFAEVKAAPVFDTAKSAYPVTALLGSSAILTCNSSGPISFSPARSSLKLNFIWFYYTNSSDPNVPVLTAISHSTDNRFLIDELGTLYIRNVREKDKRVLPNLYVCQIGGSLIQTIPSVGSYTLNVSSTAQPPSDTIRLLYKSGDLTVAVGSSFILSCLFEDSAGATEFVTWNKAFTSASGGGSSIRLDNVDASHNGTWECIYRERAEKIAVTVLQYPTISCTEDGYVTPNEQIQFNCRLTAGVGAAFQWFFNDDVIFPNQRFLITSSTSQSTLTVSKVSKLDTGVIRCAAKNDLATISWNFRFIIYDQPSLELSALTEIAAADSDPAHFEINENTTTIRFICNYSIDAEVIGEKVVWKMGTFDENITEETDAPNFGINRPAVHTYQDERLSVLTILRLPESWENQLGSVRCYLAYKIFDKQVDFPSRNNGKISSRAAPPKITPQPTFPYWIIGVVLAAILAIVLFILVIKYMRENKGEEYNVGRKEIKAGHASASKAQVSWSEFSRQDQEPISYSRTSLEALDHASL